MEDKIKELLSRLEKVEEALGSPKTLADGAKYKELSREHSYLYRLKELWSQYQKELRDLEESRLLLKEGLDPDFAEEVLADIAILEEKSQSSLAKVHALLIPPDPLDHATVIMELRAGTGGEEAALFVGDCVRMYRLYADKMGWSVETLSSTSSDAGGYREYILSFSGENAHRFLQYEAGTHRVQRVPVTETQGRVHTSAITVAVLTEPGEEEEIEIDEKIDLKIDTYRSSGAGGQHVNTTDSAVRITHLPTGVVVYCQQERSQHKNKDKAMRVLRARLVEEKRLKELKERASVRSSQVGTGDRSGRSRTYNFPQNRLTEHRIPLTMYKLDQIMDGDLKEVSESLVRHFYEQTLKAVGKKDDV